MIEIWMSIIGISMALAGIPQIIKIYKRKSSGDISVFFWFLILHGQIWWLIYGIYIKSLSLIISNTTCITISIFIIFLTFKLRKGLTNGKY